MYLRGPACRRVGESVTGFRLCWLTKGLWRRGPAHDHVSMEVNQIQITTSRERRASHSVANEEYCTSSSEQRKEIPLTVCHVISFVRGVLPILISGSGLSFNSSSVISPSYFQLTANPVHTAIDCGILGIPSALPYTSHKSAD